MPCTYDDPIGDMKRAAENGKLEAALCGILRVLQDSEQVEELSEDIRDDLGGDIAIMSMIDYNEAGITKKWLQNWWKEHQIEDALRREKEEIESREKLAKTRALAKLTPAERKALGF